MKQAGLSSGSRTIFIEGNCLARLCTAAELRYFEGGHFVLDEYADAIGEAIIETFSRWAAELGYEVMMAKDATADYSDVEMHAALDVNIPNYASPAVTTNEIVDAVSSM
jgi:hypothetical protein